MSRLRVAAVFLAVLAASAQAQSAAELLKETGVSSGLAVHYPVSDGQLEADLAATGQWVVHGLAADEKTADVARTALQARGLYGLATVETWSAGTLPYPERSLNLLILDTARIFAQAEIDRVLAPGGVALVAGKNGRARQVAPWPKDLDDWTHFCYDATGNAVSHDKVVAPANSLKFLASVLGQDIRIAHGTLYSPLRRGKGNEPVQMIARDAFNGTPRWRANTGVDAANRPAQWAASADAVFHFASTGTSYAIATDKLTGKMLRTFDKGLQRPLPGETGMGKKGVGVPVLLVCGNTLIEGYGKKIVALDIATGDLRWSYEPAAEIGYLIATPDGSRVFFQEVTDAERGRGRWGKHNTVAIGCLKDGTLAWRNETFKDTEISDLVYRDNAVYAVNPTTNLGDDGHAQIFKLSAADGTQLWASTPWKQSYNISLNNIVIQNGRIFTWGPFNNFRAYDLASGAEANLSINGYNQRCTRLSATDSYLVFGLTSWVSNKLDWIQTTVGRSDCSFPAFLAHGQTYFTYNITCHCINPVRGLIALTHEPPVTPVADAQRLDKPAAQALAPEQPAAPQNVITAEWHPDPLTFYFLGDATPPVSYKDLTLVADVHRHTLTATRAGKPVWSYTAGGRIYTAPLVHDGRAYVASADGYLSCLDAATGTPQWRFLAAPAQRRVLVYGQLESAWPVYNAVVYDGKVCVSAGRHAELDGGIRLWGLDPATGAVAWSSTLYTPPAQYPAGSKSPRDDRANIREVSSRQPLNAGLAVTDGQLHLLNPLLNGGGSRATTQGYFLKSDPKDIKLKVVELPITPAECNGKTINPQRFVTLTPKKK